MIAALRFTDARRLPDGRSLRRPVFALRSTLPLALLCAIANGVRERLRSLMAAEVEVELIEPATPNDDAKRTLLAEAHVTRIGGARADAYVVVRPIDARRLVSGAFRERERGDVTPLSEIESRVLERIVDAIVPLCAPVCGPILAVTREGPERVTRECTTYVELRISGTVRAAIGFALTGEPPEEVRGAVGLEELGDVPLEARVELGRGRVKLPAIAALRAGSVIPLTTALDDPGVLIVGGLGIARGTCGVRDGRCAFSVTESLPSRSAA
jgi:flagellar motor switch/type III secretory pathway protein FliN